MMMMLMMSSCRITHSACTLSLPHVHLLPEATMHQQPKL
jgi:hypothetical protein